MPPQERRQHRRYDLRHDALLVARGFNPVPCELANICEGGMWLEQVASPALIDQAAHTPDLPVEVHLFIATPGQELHSRTMGRVRRVDPPHLGLQFVEPAPELVRMLRDLPASRRRQLITDDRAQLQAWQAFREEVPRFLHPLLDTFVENGLEGLQQRLEKASVVREMTALKDSRMMLVEGRDALIADFMGRWQVLRDSLQGKAGARRHQDDLRVVDKALFEDWLELQMVATGLANQYRRQLFRFNQVVGQLTLQPVDDRNNPLGPVALCQCLQYAVFRAGFGDESKPALYHAFEKALQDIWPNAVERLLARLEKTGLRTIDLEDMPTHWNQEARRARQRPGPVQHPAAGPEEGTERPAETLAQPRARGSVLRLMGLQRDERGGASEGVEAAAQAVERLRPVRQDLREALGQEDTDLAGALRTLVENQPDNGLSLDSAFWDRVSLVDQLFSPLKRLEKIPETLRPLLQQLRLPALQVLLESPGFLEEADHPARRIINHLMRLCQADRGSSRSLERTVAEVVDLLLESEDLDAERLKPLEERLQSLVERQDQAFLRNAERIAKTFEGRQRLEQARRAVQRRISMRLAGREVPLVLLDLLAAGWEQLMVLAVLKEGGDSQTLAELFTVVEQIQVWLGQAEEDEEAAFERELESPALLDLIERELVAAGDPGRHREVLTRLRQHLVDEKPVDRVWLAAYPLGAPDEKPEEEKLPPDSGRWVDRAHQLQVGDWVALKDGKGETRRLRLVWVGEDAYRFVFLTPQGLHEVDYDLADMVEGLRRGDIHRVEEDQIPFVDQSLYDIVQDLYRQMAFRATHDPLTGSVHRHEFQKQLDRITRLARTPGDAGALLTFDIDQFSVINASYGMGAGDAMLREFGVMLDQARPGEVQEWVVGRLGSNEMGCIAWPLPPEAAQDLAEQIRIRFRQHGFRHQGQEFGAHLSVGILSLDSEAPDPGSLMSAANLAVKAAKKAGGDRVERAGTGQQKQQQAVLAWVSRIDQAMEDGSLSLRAQRIVPVAESPGQKPVFEILLGLKDDAGDAISPQPFIEAAEQYRRSSRVDRWVVDELLDWMTAHPEERDRVGLFNINLSGASLSDDHFLSYLEARLQAPGVAADRLCFEVTETAAVANIHYTADFMTEMKRYGCYFALDDFGTGLSSYAYLQRLPVDFVKIDGVFVKDLADNLTNYAMVRSINELSHFLGIRTIAEFVEDMEIMEALREIGVDYAQGFGIARPRPLESLKLDGKTED